jgi:putative oxidoreductase
LFIHEAAPFIKTSLCPYSIVTPRRFEGAVMISRSAVLKLKWMSSASIAGRLCLSAIFLVSGAGKLMSPQATIAEIQSAGLPLPTLGLVLATAIELLCGIALLFGFRVRWTAAILAAFTMTTAIFFHSAFADPNQFTHFLKNVAITGGLLQAVVLGDATRR